MHSKGPYTLGAPKTTSTEGSHVLVLRPTVRGIPEIMFCRVLMFVSVYYIPYTKDYMPLARWQTRSSAAKRVQRDATLARGLVAFTAGPRWTMDNYVNNVAKTCWHALHSVLQTYRYISQCLSNCFRLHSTSCKNCDWIAARIFK